MTVKKLSDEKSQDRKLLPIFVQYWHTLIPANIFLGEIHFHDIWPSFCFQFHGFRTFHFVDVSDERELISNLNYDLICLLTSDSLVANQPIKLYLSPSVVLRVVMDLVTDIVTDNRLVTNCFCN